MIVNYQTLNYSLKMFKYLFILISFIFANSTDLSSYTNGLLLDSEPNIDSSIKKQIYDFSLEETINPDTYTVGPGDSFLFNMISSDGMLTANITISPLGSILIPNVGDIFIDKLTITEAFNTIKSKCLNTYSNAQINLTLYSIRNFKVQVTGPVYRPGNVTVSPVTRVSDVYELVKDPNIEKNTKLSLRNIQLVRGLNVINVDLLKYYQNGNKELNPYVKQGDVIKFQIKDSFVSIKGGIKIPGQYEYVEKESLFSLINLAGNFTDNADTNYIHLTRFIDDKVTKEYIFENYESTKSFILNSNDYINVRYKKDYKRINLVRIDGEINYPGYYPYSESTTINDIINLSGSYTTKADSNKIIINNDVIVNNIDTEYERIMLIDAKDRTASEKSYIKSRNKITRGLIVSEDATRTDQILNYNIENGDFIYIPNFSNYIEIIGAIKFPGRYPYNEDMTINDYINEAGGKTKNATKNLYIIDNASNQRVKIKKRNKLNNGDILFIQSSEDFSPYNRFKEAMAIIAQAATVIAVINMK